MTNQEIDEEIQNARRYDGTYSLEWVQKMNNNGVWFQFRNDGIRWSRKPFN